MLKVIAKTGSTLRTENWYFMLRRSPLSAIGLLIVPFVLHCGNTPKDGSRIPGGEGGDGSGGTGGASSGGTPGVYPGGFGGYIGWIDSPDGGALDTPDGGALSGGCGDGLLQSGEACDDGNSL